MQLHFFSCIFLKMRWNGKMSWLIITYLACNFLALSKSWLIITYLACSFLALSKSINMWACLSTGIKIHKCVSRAAHAQGEKVLKNCAWLKFLMIVPLNIQKCKTYWLKSRAAPSDFCKCITLLHLPGFATSTYSQSMDRRSQVHLVYADQCHVVITAFPVHIFLKTTPMSNSLTQQANESSLVIDF